MASNNHNAECKPRYEELPVLTRDEIEARLTSEVPMDVVVALLSAGMYSESPAWVEITCLRFMDSPELVVRRAALTALCHLVRIHRSLDLVTLNPRLLQLAQDPAVAGYVEDLRDQIEVSMLRVDR